jgi:AcrR family transcriptional regulator
MGITERKTHQKQALRERILDAARRIVIREGFAALSMRKIADAIEYSPATLYLHFESRDEIARALCAEGYEQLLASFEPLAQIADPAERLKALLAPYRNGPCPVRVRYRNAVAECELPLGGEWSVRLEDALISSLGEWLQPENVQVIYQ